MKSEVVSFSGFRLTAIGCQPETGYVAFLAESCWPTAESSTSQFAFESRFQTFGELVASLQRRAKSD
jgi:hypothetical protein